MLIAVTLVLLTISLSTGMKVGERLHYSFTPQKIFATDCSRTNNINNNSYKTAYQHFPSSKLLDNKSTNSPLLCIHGFGGNADQFRKNMPFFAKEGHSTYGIDLLGYGYSDKPSPKQYEVNELYNFENWSDQVCGFVKDKIGQPTTLVCNSIGGVVGLQAALDAPDLIKEVILIDLSLRLLHVSKQSPVQKIVVPWIQYTLRETAVGPYFFKQVAQKKSLKNILNSAYAYPQKTKKGVDDETVDIILNPGLDPGAVEVFLDFISYSGGPLPETLLSKVSCPVTLMWGEHDPWEPLDLARQSFGGFPCIKDFVVLPDGGHCPMDQIPDVVNNEILKVLRASSLPSLV